jgi:organic hydroperoxide reductase OsmC/OhrA
VRVAIPRRLQLREARARVRATYEQEGSFLTGDVRSYPGEIGIELEIDSNEPQDALRELTRIAHQSCYVEHTLRTPVDVKTVDRVNGPTL